MKKTIVVLLLATLIYLCVARREKERPEVPTAPPPATPTAPTEPAAPQDNKPVFVDKYEEAVAIQGKKILFVFGSEWCGYCTVLKRDLKDMKLDGYVVCIVDVDQRPDLKRLYRASLLPTSVILKEGKEVGRKQGYSKEQYKNWLSSMEAK
jgi:thioredoxin-like negative regulator of GroEL